MSEQERIQKLLKEELSREAAKIINEVESDESLKNITLPDELDASLGAKIEQYEAKKAAYEALSEQDKEALRIGQELKIRKSKETP